LRRDLDQVDVALAGHGNRFHGADYPDLPAFFVDEADFGYPDALIDARFGR
jgi:hypothetical protein